MFRRMTTIMSAALLCALILSPPAFGQWGPRGCPPVGGNVRTSGVRHGWLKLPSGNYAWFDQGKYTGWYDPARNVWRDHYEDGEFGPETLPPWNKPEPLPPPKQLGDLPPPLIADARPFLIEQLPGARVTEEPVKENHGIDLSKMNGDDAYYLNGQKVTRLQAVNAIAGGNLRDDSGLLRLTIIGSEAERKRVLDDLGKPPLNEFRERLLVQAYEPSHWAIARAGFFAAGTPTLYLQAPSGKVLHRQDDYKDGPEGVAGAIRKAVADYDAKKDPDGRKTGPGFGWLAENWGWLAGGAVACLLMFLMVRQQAQTIKPSAQLAKAETVQSADANGDKFGPLMQHLIHEIQRDREERAARDAAIKEFKEKV